VLPATEQGIRRYLGSGLIKGIGPVMAERMVGHFGADIMRIIDDEPGRLVEVPGLGPKRSARIKDAWAEQKAIKEVMIFLQGVGVSTSLAVKIYKKYGDESIGTVKQRPYQLAADVWGIGFKTADAIAAAIGVSDVKICHDEHSVEREAAMDYYLLAVSPFPGRVMPMMRIGRHLTGARFADVVTAADAVPVAAAQWRDRRSSGGRDA